ncbi:hypothetical protein K490DRAFT_32528 [Saccharata proteae CBS 121410]|uniref:Uncharacterized protein n=1 Tax=Saccharata proteae CBS 121410 TaxID=1314787 RepID=A0A9P4M2F2_9PEZI|nr:hypothetical protein K490DRAFT_32528 [Saccharata proteae CBS 121410]
MAPPVEAFMPSELEARIQYDTNGRRRKQPIELTKCKLLEMTQYACNLVNPRDPRSSAQCEQLVRTFRRCANGLMVETTAWE